MVLLGDAYQKGLLPLSLSLSHVGSNTTSESKSKSKSKGETRSLVERVYEAMRRNALDVPSAEEYLAGKGRYDDFFTTLLGSAANIYGRCTVLYLLTCCDRQFKLVLYRRAIKEYLEVGFVPLEATMPLTYHSKEQVG